MFPFGDPGWHSELRSHDPSAVENGASGTSSRATQKRRTVMQYYSSRLMLREDYEGLRPKSQRISIHSFGKLLHQFVVDMHAKMEQQRLNFIRLNQSSLRAAVYSGLQDVIRFDDTDMSSIGKRVILPSTFIGGPRHMAQLYQDAMSLVRRFGKPDLFITFTCNPA
ncbi:hypothetical protein [Parasitella parasitica]|uniref:Helitron helicase-like domain-containing protein n=1 Tax=Parasitella parasitica TaxID=35722 RepID=A0A0B7MVZ1_9FUNG|nr:hypothetical protein [Parasitella parasitica]